MSKKTLGLITFLVILTVVLVALAVKNSQPPPPRVSQKIQPTPTITIANTTLSLNPNPAKLTKGTTALVIHMDSAGNEVTAVQLEISYDPQVLNLVSITPSKSYTNGIPILNTVDRKNGRISYAIGINPENIATSSAKTSDIATLVFTKRTIATTSASTEVKFLPKTLISARGINESVLKGSEGAIIKLMP